MTNIDNYKRITGANIGTTGSTWVYDTNNLLWANYSTDVQGYSYTFDPNTGNLSTRINTRQSKREDFEYDTDKLDRLTLVTGHSNLSVGYTTNKNGNIQTKSDAGTYVYDATQPYAVDQITNGSNISGDQQTIDYYSFEKVKKITEGTGVTQKTADFDYNADYQRIRMVLKTNGTATKTRYYFGGSCEREVVGGVTTQYIWIGGDAYSAVAVAKKVGTESWTVYNIFRDHLGTITHMKTGSTVTEYSFDAWGRRRDKDDWTTTLTSEPALFADRGFTGHEYLEDFKLYNMNGRLYDPVVGRFLSADPFIQDPGFTQSLNRYSYCLNNPLKFNDPSGEIWNLLFVWGGNWLAGGMDRWINQKQSFKQAFSPTKNPFVFSTNFSPSNTNRQNNYGFSHPQIVAQKAANHEELVAQQLDDFVTSQSGRGDDYFQIYGEFTLSLGPQLGAGLSAGVPILAGFIQGPSMEVKYKPYIRYTNSYGWSLGIDISKKNLNYKKGYSYPFNSYEKSSSYGLSEHPVFSKTTTERQRGFVKTNTTDAVEEQFFRLNYGTTIRPLLFGVGFDFGIEGPDDNAY